MKPITLKFLLALSLALPGLAAATDYRVLPASRLGFSDTFQGAVFEGSFTQWAALISYDPTQLSASRFDVTVDTASARTGDHDRDTALPGADFFNIASYPKARFVSTAFRHVGSRVIVDGQMTLRGVTRPISLEVHFVPNGSTTTLDATGSLNRLDYGVGGGEYADASVIGAQVSVHAHLLLTAK